MPSSHSTVPRPPTRASQRKAAVPRVTHSAPPAAQSGSAVRRDAAMASTTAEPAKASATAPPRWTPHSREPTEMTPVAAVAAPVAPKPWPVASRAHSQHIPKVMSSTSAASHQPPSHTAASATGAMTKADMIRSLSVLGFGSARSNGSAVATFAAVIVAQRLLEIGLAEVGPQRLREDELGIGGLPQQEIADALLAAGADDEVGIGHVGGQQVAGEQALIDGFGREPARLHRLGDRARGAGDLGATAIGERDGEAQAAIVAGQRLGVI